MNQTRRNTHSLKLKRKTSLPAKLCAWNTAEEGAWFSMTQVSYNARYVKYRGVKKPSFLQFLPIKAAGLDFELQRPFCGMYAIGVFLVCFFCFLIYTFVKKRFITTTV